MDLGTVFIVIPDIRSVNKNPSILFPGPKMRADAHVVQSKKPIREKACDEPFYKGAPG